MLTCAKGISLSQAAQAHTPMPRLDMPCRSGTSTSNGNVTVIAGEGDITLNGGNGTLSTNFATARIGHGGWKSGDKTGIITVTASDGSILVQGGLGNTTTSTYNFAQIGHGGYGNGATQNIVDQAIHVTAWNGDVTVNGGTCLLQLRPDRPWRSRTNQLFPR